MQGQPTGCLFGNNTNQQGQATGALFGNNTNTQDWSTGDPFINRAKGGLFGHCSSGQGLFGCIGNVIRPSGAYDPRSFTHSLPVPHGLLAHPTSCNTAVTVNLNGLAISDTKPSRRGDFSCCCNGSNSIEHNNNQLEEQRTGCICRTEPPRCFCNYCQQEPNNCNIDTANYAPNRDGQLKPGHQGLWSSPFSPATTHAHVAKGSLVGPSARGRLQRRFEDSPSTLWTREAPHGSLFGAQPNETDTAEDAPANDRPTGGLFGQYTSVPSASNTRPPGNCVGCVAYPPTCTAHTRSLFGGITPTIEGTAEPKTPEPETFRSYIAAHGESLFGPAPSKPEKSELTGPSTSVGPRAKPTTSGFEGKSGLFGDYSARPTGQKLSKAAVEHQGIIAADYKWALETHDRLTAEGRRVPNSIFEMMKSALLEYPRAVLESERIIREGGVVPEDMKFILEAGSLHPTPDSKVNTRLYEAGPEISDSIRRRERILTSSSDTEDEPNGARSEKKARFSATVEDVNSPSDADSKEKIISVANKAKDKAVSTPRPPTEASNNKKKVSPESTTQGSAPAAKTDAASSGGGLMDSVWAAPAKLAGHTSTVTEADNGTSGTIPNLSRVGAAMRAAAEQTASVPDVPGSMFAPKPATSGAGVAETATTQQSPASRFMFAPAPSPAPVAPGIDASDLAPRSIFVPSPGPVAPSLSAPGPAPAPETTALGLSAPSPFAADSAAPSPFAPGAASFGAASVRPTVIPLKDQVNESAGKPVEETVQKPVRKAVKESVKVEKPAAEVQEPAKPSTQTSAAQKPAAQKPAVEKKVQSGGLWDSQWAS